MYNKEMSMILDTFAVVYALRAVQFRIQFKRVTEDRTIHHRTPFSPFRTTPRSP